MKDYIEIASAFIESVFDIIAEFVENHFLIASLLGAVMVIIVLVLIFR